LLIFIELVVIMCKVFDLWECFFVVLFVVFMKIEVLLLVGVMGSSIWLNLLVRFFIVRLFFIVNVSGLCEVRVVIELNLWWFVVFVICL